MNHNERDYRRVEQAIHYLNSRFRSQPSLEELARHVGLSSFHFQRLFRRWAGVTPKRFLQHLTTHYAQELLRDSTTVLETTFAAGLSSPGRLHDLFVAVEAMSPGEFKNGGQGLEILYGLGTSPFGACLLARTQRGICGLEFIDPPNNSDPGDDPVHALTARWPNATLREDTPGTRHLVEAIFNDGFDDELRTRTQHLLHLPGTNFQLQVWRALLHIPAGSAISYQGLAERLGHPKAARAVASAVAQNRVGYLIPCHRVIRSTGAVGGYRWGTARKQAILARETSAANVTIR